MHQTGSDGRDSPRLLEVRGLRVDFPTPYGRVKAVDGVDFHLQPGETLGIVGESGSGKSVTVLSIMRLLAQPGRIAGGEILFRGRNLLDLSEREMQEIRGSQIAMIFQDPMTSLNPVYRIGWQVGEPLRVHRHLKVAASALGALSMLQKVGIPQAQRRADSYPHEFSGGMRQRAMIAMALTTRPAVLIADEPTTALDVTIQAQILDLLGSVNREFGTATVLITHNLGVVAGMCERVMVMYAGRVVEEGSTERVFTRPKHPYTWSLLRSIPRLDGPTGQALQAIEGLPPDLTNLPNGCAFHPRCPFARERCRVERPRLDAARSAHRASCWVTQAGGNLPPLTSRGAGLDA